MKIDQLITIIIFVFLVIGAVEYLRKKPLGQEFEAGMMSAGRLLLYMAGFIVLAPVLAGVLTPIFAPLFASFGADPSMIAGLILANDAGASMLAMQMAQNEAAGQFSGWIVGSMLGTTIMFVFPMAMGSAKAHQFKAVTYGLLCGIATVPVGCLVGGLISGMSGPVLWLNLIPVAVVSLSLLVALVIKGEKIVPVFVKVGQCVTILCCAGLVLGALDLLLGVKLISGMGSIQEAFAIVGQITLFLAGAFPLIAVLRKICRPLFVRVGKRLRLNETSVSGLLVTLANGIPVFGLLDEMSDRGIMVNLAFMVSASCALGDHLAYTAGTAPELTAAVLIGKLAGGVSAVCLALFLADRLLSPAATMSNGD